MCMGLGSLRSEGVEVEDPAKMRETKKIKNLVLKYVCTSLVLEGNWLIDF